MLRISQAFGDIHRFGDIHEMIDAEHNGLVLFRKYFQKISLLKNIGILKTLSFLFKAFLNGHY